MILTPSCPYYDSSNIHHFRVYYYDRLCPLALPRPVIQVNRKLQVNPGRTANDTHTSETMVWVILPGNEARLDGVLAREKVSMEWAEEGRYESQLPPCDQLQK